MPTEVSPNEHILREPGSFQLDPSGEGVAIDETKRLIASNKVEGTPVYKERPVLAFADLRIYWKCKLRHRKSSLFVGIAGLSPACRRDTRASDPPSVSALGRREARTSLESALRCTGR